MKTTLNGADVVAAWGLANAVLLAMLCGFGERTLPEVLYASSAALVEVFALIAWLVMRRHDAWAATSPAPRRSRSALLTALAVGFVGAGAIWGWWIALIALYPALAAAAELVPPARPQVALRPVRRTGPRSRQPNRLLDLTFLGALGAAGVVLLRRRARQREDDR